MSTTRAGACSAADRFRFNFVLPSADRSVGVSSADGEAAAAATEAAKGVLNSWRAARRWPIIWQPARQAPHMTDACVSRAALQEVPYRALRGARICLGGPGWRPENAMEEGKPFAPLAHGTEGTSGSLLAATPLCKLRQCRRPASRYLTRTVGARSVPRTSAPPRGGSLRLHLVSQVDPPKRDTEQNARDLHDSPSAAPTSQSADAPMD